MGDPDPEPEEAEAGVPPFAGCGLRWCLRQLDAEELRAFKELLVGGAAAAAALPGAFPWAQVPGADAQRLAGLLHEHCGPLEAWAAAADAFQELSLPELAAKAREEMEKCSLAEILQDFTPPRTDRDTGTDRQPPEVPHVVKQDGATAAATGDQEVPQLVKQKDATAATTGDQEVPQLVKQKDATAATTGDQEVPQLVKQKDATAAMTGDQEVPEGVKEDDATAATTGDQDPGPGCPEGTYRRHVMARFAPTRDDAHPNFQAFSADCPPLRALAAAFDPDGQGRRPLTVVLHGSPGVGKSALARRILLHWARGELYPGLFDYAFFLDARDVPWRRRSSLAELLAEEWPGPGAPDAAARILAGPESRLLFVIDGAGDLDLDPEAACHSPTERYPVATLVGGLLAKALLPACSLVLTARDGDLGELQGMLDCPRLLLVEGISTEARVRALLKHVRGDEGRRAHVLQAVLDDHGLAGRGEAALAWWLLCRALELQAAPADGQPPPEHLTLTGLYATFVAHQLAPEGGEDSDGPGCGLGPDERAALKGLCRLAARGVWARRRLFHAEDLGAHGLAGAALAGLLRRRLLLRGPGGRGAAFPHPGLQAFFAALAFALPGPDPAPPAWGPPAARPGPPEPPPGAAAGLPPPLRRFLFGLAGPAAKGALRALLGAGPAAKARAALRAALLRWVALLGRPAPPAPADLLAAFHCVFEAQDDGFARAALGGLRAARLALARPADLRAAAFCLRRAGALRAARLDVRAALPGDEPAAAAWPVLPPRLQSRPLVLEWWESLCSVLSTHPSLEELDLAGSVLSEWALRTLCAKLRLPDCKIQKLRFKGTQIAPGLHYLWKALIINQSIRHLNLDNIHLQEEDIKVVQEALAHPHCVLESLRLDHCGLTSACCPALAQTLLASRSLTTLSLAGNKVTDEGVASLCEALKVPPCTLRRLVLGSCGLTDAACQHLSEVLAGGRTLTHLDVSSNPLGRDGVALLCRGFKALPCALQRLMLRDCGLDAIGCGFLSLGLVGSRHLTHLSLSLNALGDAGADLLSEALLAPAARLRDLELVRCGLTAACCRKLSVVAGTSPHLQSLDLAANALGDAGVAALCTGLRLKTARLRRLGLEACELTSASCEPLAAVLLCSRALLSLNLLRNPLGAGGVRALCRALGRPAAKLQVLGLCKWQFPEDVARLLEEAELRRPSLVIDSRWYGEDGEDEADRYWWRS